MLGISLNPGSDAPKLAALGMLGDKDEMPGSYQHLQFNPNQLTVTMVNNYQDQTTPGAGKITQTSTGVNQRTLSTQFFFDTSGNGQDVRDKTKCVMDMLQKRGKSSAPPICVFVYGAFMFVGSVVSATLRFIMFSREGKPIRATIDVTMSEYKSMSGESFVTPPEVEMKTAVKKSGEELFLIAAREYGNPAMWRMIAKANGIPNPRVVPVGMQLNIMLSI